MHQIACLIPEEQMLQQRLWPSANSYLEEPAIARE